MSGIYDGGATPAEPPTPPPAPLSPAAGDILVPDYAEADPEAPTAPGAFEAEGAPARAVRPKLLVAGLPATHVGAAAAFAGLLVWLVILLSSESEPSEYTALDAARTQRTHPAATPSGVPAPEPPPPPPDVDCVMVYSACTSVCEDASTRTATIATAQSGNGAQCTFIGVACARGEGACPPAPVVAPPPAVVRAAGPTSCAEALAQLGPTHPRQTMPPLPCLEVPPCGAAVATADLQYVVGDYSGGSGGGPGQSWPPADEFDAADVLPTTADICHDDDGLLVRWHSTDPGAKYSTQVGCRDPVCVAGHGPYKLEC
jgi:hypothetical protein